MKALAVITVLTLLAAALATFVGDAHAQDDPYILGQIAADAEQQIKDQLDKTYGDNMPDDIAGVLDECMQEVDHLEQTLADAEIEQAKGHFLSAMKHFKQITKMIAAAEPPSRSSEAFEQSESIRDGESHAEGGNPDRDLSSELNRITKHVERLKEVSERHNAGIDFAGIDDLIDHAHSEIAVGNTDLAETFDRLNSLIGSIEENLHEHAQHGASDRARQFVKQHLVDIEERLDTAADAGADSSQISGARGLLEEIRIMITEEMVDDAKQALRELTSIVTQIEESIAPATA